MPSGGQLSSGSGLRLQPAYPGIQDLGNGNISGTLHAARFTTTPPVNDGGSTGGEQFGHDFSYVNGASFPTNSTANFGIANIVSGAITNGPIIGTQNQMCGQNAACIGHNNVVGNAVDFPNSCLGMGRFVQVNAAGAGDSVSETVGIGSNVIVSNRSLAVGRNLNIQNDNGTANSTTKESVVFGNTITSNTPNSFQNLLIGRGITSTKQRQIIIGWFNGDQPPEEDFLITIGSLVQGVRLGGLRFVNGVGLATSVVNDTNFNAAASMAVIQYATLTAARIVTLPPASGCPAGLTIRIIDFSGNCSAVRTITVNVSGGDTAHGFHVMNSAFDVHDYMSDGVSIWQELYDRA